MTAGEEEALSPMPESGSIDGARSKGSLLEEDDASSAEEKKDVTPEEVIDDTSVPLANSFDDEDSNLDDADNSAAVNNSDSKEENNGDGEPCPRWADVLCTPSSAAVFTPTADINSLKQNMHGWGEKIENFFCSTLLEISF